MYNNTQWVLLVLSHKLENDSTIIDIMVVTAYTTRATFGIVLK